MAEIVTTVDVDEKPEVARSSGIRGVPSLLLPSGELVVGEAKIIDFLRGVNA